MVLSHGAKSSLSSVVEKAEGEKSGETKDVWGGGIWSTDRASRDSGGTRSFGGRSQKSRVDTIDRASVPYR